MYKPTEPITLVATDEQLLNGITKDIGGFFRSGAPIVKAGDTDSRKAYGYYVTGSGDFMNAFFSSVVNRIARVMMFNKLYFGKLRKFKKGMLGPGDVLESIYAGIIMPQGFTSDVEHPGDCYQVNKPEVRAAYHPVNSRLVYPITTNADVLMTAITQDLQGFITKIIGQLYNSIYIDEDIMIKYVMCRSILENWDDFTVEVPTVTKQTSNDLVQIMKQTSLDLQWNSKKYNAMHMDAFTPIESQHFFLTNKVSACVDVNSLSAAFQLPYMQFLGQREQINFFGFTEDEQERLDTIMSETVAQGLVPDYKPFTDEEKAKLARVVACTIDEDFLLIFDQLFRTTSKFDELHLNTTLRAFVFKVYSYNPFANCVVFVEPEQTKEITVTPKESTDTIFDYTVSDLQTNVAIAKNKITGTLNYIDSGSLATRWGAGNFLALDFSSDDWNKYDAILVGMDPSVSSGLVDIKADPDRDGAFKITSTSQKFVVKTLKGDIVETTQYDLSGLVLNAS